MSEAVLAVSSAYVGVVGRFLVCRLSGQFAATRAFHTCAAGMAQHRDLVSEIDVRQCWALNENKEEQSTLGNCLTAELRMPPSYVET